MSDNDRVATTVRELVLADFAKRAAPRPFAPKAVWQPLVDGGTELWLDTGDLEGAQRLWCAQFRALTTNNTLLNKEVQKGIYDQRIGQVARALRGVVPERELVIEIAFFLNAYHALRLVEAFGGRVSVELHTDLAHDVDRTVVYGRRYFAICPDHFIIKVPMTAAGFVAARRLGQAGVPVNFTLGFSARQNYLAAAFSRPAFVNVFLGRLKSFVSDNRVGDGRHVGEKATLASQRAVRELRRQLGVPTRQIAASMRDGSEVAALAGCDVFTMPIKVVEEYEAAPAAIRSRLDDDPAISLAPGVDGRAIGLDTLWDVPDALRQAVARLMQERLDRFGPQELAAFLAEAGLRDLMPRWSKAETALCTREGKIPVLGHWDDQLAERRIGLDALMNLSALQSFCVDQAAMDERIRKML